MHIRLFRHLCPTKNGYGHHLRSKQAHCTAADYKTLYQFTVTYLRDSLGVRNFMYAWSPDKNFNSEAEYLERYPGDEYVDLVGTDNYGDLTVGVSPAVAANKLALVPTPPIPTGRLIKVMQHRPTL